MSLARRANEPELKQRYEDLAVEYAVKAAARGDTDAVRWVETTTAAISSNKVAPSAERAWGRGLFTSLSGQGCRGMGWPPQPF